jgi:WD40 repeat protein
MPPLSRASIGLIIRSAVLFSSLAVVATPVDAQYFGRNRVRYETFDFRILKTEHFDIYYYDDEAEVMPLVARMAERWNERLSRMFGHELSGRQPIILYASHPHFTQTTALLGGVGEGTQGATEPFRRRVVLPLAGTLEETDHVLGHEIVHAFQFSITAQNGLAFVPPSALGMPLWFIEGMAEYLTIGHEDPHTAMWMRDAARREKLPTAAQLENPRYFPYRYGQALWAYVTGRWGDELASQLLRRSAETAAVFPTIQLILGTSPDSLVKAWTAATHEAYGTLVDSTRAAGDYGGPVLADARLAKDDKKREEGRRGGRLNVAPALSPDGTQLVFLSERDGISIDMFLADVATGDVKRKIVETGLDPHFESLQFAKSAGAWHPDGRRFAFAGVTQGRPVVSILDVTSGKILREFPVQQAQEVFHPTWSPDGARLAFSALSSGFTDLFIIDMADGQTRRLTHDAFADLHPAWSPDGKSIAVATDRFTTNLDNLSYGDFRLALADPATGEMRALPHFERGKHINPQWGPNSESLFFLSDRTGITNVYRLELATQSITQVTNLYTGVSGITALSPALSVATQAPRLVYSAFEDERHGLFSIDSAAVLAGVPVLESFAMNPALLPPVDRSRPSPLVEVAALLADPDLGLPPADSVPESVDYHPRLALDFINPASIGVGGGGVFGTFVGGGSAVFWGDMLRQHYLTTGLQVFGGFEDIAAVVAYRNVRSRWTWGVTAAQQPFLSIGFRRRVGQAANADIVDSLFRFRQTDRHLGTVLAYPFSRVQRIEFNAGYRQSSFDREVVSRVIQTSPPRVIIQDPVDLPAPSAIGQWEASAALVHDNTLFGPTAPVLGQRYRLELGPSLGALTYYNVLVDYRRYVTPKRPYTIAARFLHYGRYGPDSDDERLVPLFIGYQTLVRGYASNSFDLSECAVIIRDPSDCPVPVFQELLGSRVMVANLELRFPLLQGLGIKNPSPRIPWVDLALFYDAGIAWRQDDEPSFLGGDRGLLTSYGAALRANVFGAAIIEVDFVHPNGRPGGRWYWQFGFSPGW